MGMIDVKVRLYGAFRTYGNGEETEVRIPRGSGLEALREAIAARLGADAGLLAESAFADESAVLPAGARLERSCAIAVLPPVCGG